MTSEEAILHNLVCFNLNFSKHAGINDIAYQSPSYILEKFNKWIAGEEPRKYWEFTPKYRTFEFKQVDLAEVIASLDDNNVFTFMEYKRIWGSDARRVETILIYLLLTKNLNLFNCVNQFERLIGPLDKINDIETRGLHELVMTRLYPVVMEKNQKAIEMVKRELKLKKIVD